MFNKLLGNGIIVTPFLRFVTSSGASLDPTFSSGSAVFTWVSPDGSLSTGAIPSPVLDQAGAYAIKADDWSLAYEIMSFVNDNIISLTNLELIAGRVTFLDVNGNTGLVEMGGIEKCTQLTNLNYRDCSLPDLDLSALVNLEQLRCRDNGINVLDVSTLVSITTMLVNTNNISVLDVAGLTDLLLLWCYDNTIPSLDVAALTSLTNFKCQDNGMTQTAVDDILVGLVTAGASGGTVIINGTNAAPSATGLSAKSTLEGRGWTVTVTV